MNPLLLVLAPALLLQVGPNPAVGGMPGIPDELRDRPPRENSEPVEVEQSDPRLAACLADAEVAPAAAFEASAEWIEGAQGLDLAHGWHCHGIAAAGLGQTEDAASAFRTALASVPEAEHAYRAELGALAGLAEMGGGNPAGALAAFEAAELEAESQGEAAFIGAIATDRATALVALGREGEAATALATARALDPGNARAWLLSATLSRRMGDLAAAQGQIERAAELDPRDPATGLEAGVIAALAGRDDAARKSWQSVIDLDPQAVTADYARAYLAQLEGAPSSEDGR